MKRLLNFCVILTFAVLSGMTFSAASVWGQSTDDPAYKPNPEVEKTRMESLKKTLPEGEKLLVWLDGGRDWIKTDKETGVSLEVVKGKSWTFLEVLNMKDVPQSQAYVVFDSQEIPMVISGLDKTKKYKVHVLWWDFDNNDRTQSIWLKSPDQHRVKQVVTPARIPDYKESKLMAAEKTIMLPSTFIQDGKIRLEVEGMGGNVVVNEVWITVAE